MRKPSRSRRPVIQSRERLTAALSRARAAAEEDYRNLRLRLWEAGTGEVPAAWAAALQEDAEKQAERSARRVERLEAALTV
jgi:hypothetical protein